MKVIISMNAHGKRKVYHRSGCMYEKRIPDRYKMSLVKEKAEKYGFCECSFCSGFSGFLYVHKRSIAKMERNCGIKTYFDRKTQALYVATEIGGWKMCDNDGGKFYLRHMNHFTPGMSFEEMTHASYHNQRDVDATSSVESLLEYIVSHDRAKKIIKDDYRKLPHATKKQKKYYKQAEKRERMKKRRRLNAIFSSLEEKDPTLKQYSIC